MYLALSFPHHSFIASNTSPPRHLGTFSTGHSTTQANMKFVLLLMVAMALFASMVAAGKKQLDM